MSDLSKMPVVTVEQVVEFRREALDTITKLRAENKSLKDENEELKASSRSMHLAAISATRLIKQGRYAKAQLTMQAVTGSGESDMSYENGFTFEQKEVERESTLPRRGLPDTIEAWRRHCHLIGDTVESQREEISKLSQKVNNLEQKVKKLRAENEELESHLDALYGRRVI